ncbi:MAG: serine/threonine protein kinase [Lentisphaeria bacterium]|nr:serine/threonine protein kinase [Lentisphaeria bacterium]
MRFQCNHCGGILAIDECEPGEAVACGHCGSAVTVPETRVSPAAVVGDFVIRDRLGAGGMGSVYLAHQVSLDRPAALKILHHRYGVDDAYIADFIREARAAAALNHPSIVQAYAVGEDEGLFYFAMEYVCGSTLKEVLLHGGRLVWERALQIGIQVAGALDFAFRNQGLIHRDIKPDNIILTADGNVKVADLGLARKMTDTAQDGTRELYGTPQYIAPEQLLGHPGDCRSDIYSLGATLYQALSGRFPYEGSDPGEIALKHLSDPLPALTDLHADIPAPMARIVQVALSKRPHQRYADGAAFLADLQRVQSGEPPLARLDPGSQKPIEPDSDEAVAIAEGGDAAGAAAPGPAPAPSRGHTGRLRRITVPGARSGDSPEAARLPSGARGGAGKRSAGSGAGVPAQRKSFGVLLAVGAAVAVVVLGAGAFYLLRPGNGGSVGGGDGSAGPGSGGGTARVPAAEIRAALDAIREAGARGEAPNEMRRRLASLARTHGYDHPEAETFAALAAPFREEDLEAARAAPEAAATERWQQQLAERRREAQAQQEQNRQAAAAEAERKRQEEEARRQAEAEAQRQAAKARERTELRWQSIELCRQQRFDEASTLFVPMSAARDEGERDWARARQSCIAMAEELLDTIVNTKEELAGTELPLQRQQRGEWKVSRIGFRDVELQSRRVTYSRGVRSEDMETLEIPFTELTAVQLDILTKRKWERDGGEENRRLLLFGAYLLCRAQFLPEARKRLETCGLPEAQPLLDELAVVEPELRRMEFERWLEQLQQLGSQGDMPRAKALLEYLERTFPEETEENRTRLQELIPKP